MLQYIYHCGGGILNHFHDQATLYFLRTPKLLFTHNVMCYHIIRYQCLMHRPRGSNSNVYNNLWHVLRPGNKHSELSVFITSSQVLLSQLAVQNSHYATSYSVHNSQSLLLTV